MQFFIVAGHETTALALSWSLLLLAWDQDAQARAREQARAALGDAPAGAEHLEKTPYVKQVIEEAMRLYPPVGLLARNVRQSGYAYAVETSFPAIYALPSNLRAPPSSDVVEERQINLIRTISAPEAVQSA